MSVQHRELLDWASDSFATNNQCEITRRACISRAYYSSLHGVQDGFEIEIEPDQPSSHKAIIDALTLQSRKPGQGRTNAVILAKLLPKLKRLRVKADYRLDDDVTADDVIRALATAKEAIEKCDDVIRLRKQ